MLKQRIITALVLAPLAILAILFLSVDAFQLVVAIVMGLGAYEWGNMSGLIQRRMKLVFTIIISANLRRIKFMGTGESDLAARPIA